MKKILNLLTVLVISGTAVTTSVAVSPYQKEETIKNTNINEQQTDNMKELNKNEKEENNINMFGFFEKHVKSYFNNFVELSKKNIKSLINNFLNFAVEKNI